MPLSNNYLARIGSTDLPKIKEYTVQRNKLYSDAGRNLSGKLRASFIGIFPKIVVTLAPLDEDEMATVLDLIDAPSFTLHWWDAESETNKSGAYYAGDVEVSVLKKLDGLYNELKISLIPYQKMT